MINQLKKISLITLTLTTIFFACSKDDDNTRPMTENPVVNEDTNIGTVDTNDPVDTTVIHKAFAEFDEDFTDIYLDGTNIVIEAKGEPNHVTPYYSESHELYTAPTVTTEAQMTPTRIDTSGRDHELTLTVPQNPEIASSTTTTSLGPIGVAVSGAYIYNDQEGNGELDAAAVSLDYTGAHIGPDFYHYHLEPKAFTNDDGNLVGIIADGFFIYGRRDYPSNEYPTDLDASGGHFGPTPHNPDGEYHYHIIDEVYSTTGTYIVFAGPYIGTPNAFN